MQPSLADQPATMINPASSSTPLQRFLSLDVVRGITIAFMIMVNNNGGPGSWHFMNHAEWNGLTPTDLVFPTFVFVVGVSIVFAFDARLSRGASRARLALHTLQRAAVLFLFGILVNTFPYFALPHMRFYGVLQRIAVCYLVVGLFYLWDQRVSTKLSRSSFRSSGIGSWSVGFLFQAWPSRPRHPLYGHDPEPCLMDRPPCLSPSPLSLLPDHNVRDPEGLLSDLPAFGTALMGVLTGLWLRSRRTVPAKTAGLAAAPSPALRSAISGPLNSR